jgi:tRNA wybutosine-synthesizing protein 2
LKLTGGFLHIHGNVDLNRHSQKSKIKHEWILWADYAKEKICLLLNELNKIDEKMKWIVKVDHIEYVKSYGPRIDHLVVDLDCRPEL